MNRLSRLLQTVPLPKRLREILISFSGMPEFRQEQDHVRDGLKQLENVCTEKFHLLENRLNELANGHEEWKTAYSKALRLKTVRGKDLSFSFPQNGVPRVSIVICTLNRAVPLRKTLESLETLKYPGDFEVIVVPGPCEDNTEEVLKDWEGRIRVVPSKLKNLSYSRNRGIEASGGDLVAFLDDDALPLADWLCRLADCFKNPGVGGAGGLVLDRTGFEIQRSYCDLNRYGNPYVNLADPTPAYRSFPHSPRTPVVLGANCVFRRDVLMDVGGFDEEFEYYHDETDLCLRIIDAGYQILQSETAVVHHKNAPSSVRNTEDQLIRVFPILKNTMYFMMKHASAFYSEDEILNEYERFSTNLLQEQTGIQDDDSKGRQEYAAQVEAARKEGYAKGLEEPASPGKRKSWLNQQSSDALFSPTFIKPVMDAAVFVLVSRERTQEMNQLAQELVAGGHSVFIITESKADPLAELESGFWVHAIGERIDDEAACPPKNGVESSDWNWSLAAKQEVLRIQGMIHVDGIVAGMDQLEASAICAGIKAIPIITLVDFSSQEKSRRSGVKEAIEESSGIILPEGQEGSENLSAFNSHVLKESGDTLVAALFEILHT